MLQHMKVELRPIDSLRPHERNARTHSKKQIRQIGESIKRFGFNNPVLIGDAGEIIAGHGRVEAARLIGMAEVPTLLLSHLSRDERRAYVLADNKLALNAGWDTEMLAIEFQDLLDLEIGFEGTGFSVAEIDFTIQDAKKRQLDPADAPENVVPVLSGPAVSRLGDAWLLGRHRLVCGDAQESPTYDLLLEGGEQVDLIFTDPPFNLKIDGNVCGLGAVRHREFAMASGEMSSVEFTSFLAVTLTLAGAATRDGAIAFICMDWRHAGELLTAGRLAFTELKQLCVWNKTNGGMGTFYRSKHELVFVFKLGTAPHVNNFGLGDGGRYRTNVWDYPGISSMSTTRMSELARHPTSKPVALVTDAILDCSKRGAIVLDCFGGSGTTLIAAESCGRRARLIELDPLYCDTIVTRYEAYTSKTAILAATGESFADAREMRLGAEVR